MNRLQSIGSGMAIAALLAGTASAQGRLRSEPPRPKKLSGSPLTLAETRLVMAEFAKCVAKKHRSKAQAFVLDESWTQTKKVNQLTDENCLIESMERLGKVVAIQFAYDLFDYALAEALVKDELPSFARSQIDQAAPLGHPTLGPADFVPVAGKTYTPEQLKSMEKAKSARLARIAFSQFGECVVRADPAGSHRLLMTALNGPEEDAALNDMQAAMGGCIGKGVEFKANESMMRGVIATSYYRLARTPRSAAHEAAK